MKPLRWHAVFLSLLVPFAGCLAGCDLLGVAAHVFEPPPKIEAEFVPEPVPTLVYADNFANRGQDFVSTEQVARYAGDALAEREIVPVVGAMELDTLKTLRPREFARMSAAELARETGASQVLRIDLSGVQVTAAGGSERYTATAVAKVTLLDTQGNVLYPLDSADGREVVAKVDVGDANSTRPQAARVAVLRQLGNRVADLFRTYRVDEGP